MFNDTCAWYDVLARSMDQPQRVCSRMSCISRYAKLQDQQCQGCGPISLALMCQALAFAEGGLALARQGADRREALGTGSVEMAHQSLSVVFGVFDSGPPSELCLRLQWLILFRFVEIRITAKAVEAQKRPEASALS